MALTLAPSENQPIITWGPLGASALASTVIPGSVGWYREKRQSSAEVLPGMSQTSTQPLDLVNSTYFRYPGLPEAQGFAANPTHYVVPTYKPGGLPQNAKWFFNVEFVTSSRVVVLRLNAPTASIQFGRIIIDGLPISETVTAGTGLTAGNGYHLKLEFPDSRSRTITILRLNGSDGRFGGVAIEPGHTITKPTDSVPLFVALGDSYTNGHAEVSAVDTFAFQVAAQLGYARGYIGAGIGSTGFRATITGEPASAYAERIPFINNMRPEVVLVTGGRNDTESDLVSAVESVLSSLSTPTIYVATTASESAQAGVRSQIASACDMLNIPYFDVAIDTLSKIPDNIHPSPAGHAALADQLTSAIRLYAAQPLPLFTGVAQAKHLSIGEKTVEQLYLGEKRLWTKGGSNE